jgi:chromosomal replication initiation ATPase DnaA
MISAGSSGGSSGRGGRQLSFDLGHRPALGNEDFLVSPCNREAVDWIDLWPEWPSPVLVLCGPAGSGKSHLAAVWRERSGAKLVTADDIVGAPGAVTRGEPHHLIDPADAIADQEAFLHLYNRVADAGGTLLLTAATAPSRWPLTLADLTSRLRAAPVATIGQPDDALLGAVLVKMFSDRQLGVPPEVIAFLLVRMERSFAAARSLVELLDRRALAEKRALTVPFVRSVLDTPD